ncbi:MULTISPECIES: winged helix-turn-helix domain-containing protein [Paenibacillus]|uniref:ArsR/SmtB family transcription factor n=1 Tax=Paenibacillus TaxID=44249 RepID=UPI002FDFC464
MTYQLDIEYKAIYELANSLHTYICRKSHKKIMLAPNWVKEVGRTLTPEFASLLGRMEVDADWKWTYLLLYLCREGEHAEDFLSWLEGKSVGDLYELMAEYGQPFPKDMGQFRSRTLSIFPQWNEQYFKHTDSAIRESLRLEAERRKKELAAQERHGDLAERMTRGLVFEPKEGLERLVLVPQYHFQPMNVIYHFGKITLCHYSARVSNDNPSAFPQPEYLTIRALGEQNRLKVLRLLHEGPKSFSEIVRHLNISKGITHDHISKLRTGGLIRAHIEGETVTEYSLRLDSLEELQKKLMAYITNE